MSEILKKSWAPAVDDFDVDLADHNVHNVSCSGSTINFNTVQDDFKALQYSLFISVIVEVLGAFFFFITAWYIIDDKARVDRAVAGWCLSLSFALLLSYSLSLFLCALLNPFIFFAYFPRALEKETLQGVSFSKIQKFQKVGNK